MELSGGEVCHVSFNLALFCYLLRIICSILDAQRQLSLIDSQEICIIQSRLVLHKSKAKPFSLSRLAMLCGRVNPNIKELLLQFVCYVVSASATWWQQTPATFCTGASQMIRLLFYFSSNHSFQGGSGHCICHITTAGCHFLQDNSLKAGSSF